MSDSSLARKAKLIHIQEVASALGILEADIEPYGRMKAKLSYEFLHRLEGRPEGKLILVTAMSPTPAGEGKTTTTIGLSDALNRLGKKTIACLREPSLGPCFGMKGGATGGGHAQVAPMEDINLHLTGDFHAITTAHNLLAAVLDNHMQHGNDLNIDPHRVVWRRAMDMNDRSLRHTIIGLGGKHNGITREDGFDITVASEIMAILCLSSSLHELRDRLSRILVAYTKDGEEVHAGQLKVHGAMTALMRDAMKPNLLQTLENNPVIVHGGPFANIAHGCNSVSATRTALKLAEYVVTEAGFGADLGAEKFMDIKCRKSGLRPNAAVLVATVRALKFHGGQALEDLGKCNIEALRAGVPNLQRHLQNLQHCFQLPVVVAINYFNTDSEEEIEFLTKEIERLGAASAVCRHWQDGSAGAMALAEKVVTVLEKREPQACCLLYPDEMPLADKIRTIAQKIYGATDISLDPKALRYLNELDQTYRHFPVCIAKTQYSFSADPTLLGAPAGFNLPVKEVILRKGAEFIVAICGEIMTMPGLPKHPASEKIDIDAHGQITGLF